MASICSIIPEHLLETIIERGNAPDDIVAECRSTLDRNNQLRAARIEDSQQIASASQGLTQEPAGAQGIVPPYIHQAILRGTAGEEEREESRRALEQDAKFRAARRSGRHLNRTVYDAQHRESFSRDKILIREGGPLVSKINDPSMDANECYIGFEKTYDFYLKYFNRDSLNNGGLPLDGFVHYGKNFGNAFWDGEKMVFGDGSKLFNGLTDELDVIGHELTHGVVNYTCNLEYWFQSGALNESLADVFGIMVKQWSENPDRPQTAAEANWLIGEGIWREGINGRALRDMKNPGTAFDDPMTGKDPQPAHWKDFAVLPGTKKGDWGGVHVNSGIPNRAFALAATKIGGFAWEGAGQIWYKAMSSVELKRTATFKEFADATINNAGEHAVDVKKAWEEVGYPFP
ncbi:hypothetical protein V491_07761 [Pseudogymnoascus sp. VKM F-3775]|nr:hypothetical protein V491_07761 [Pseudogymnoascus sp. VKM F-3775]